MPQITTWSASKIVYRDRICSHCGNYWKNEDKIENQMSKLEAVFAFDDHDEYELMTENGLKNKVKNYQNYMTDCLCPDCGSLSEECKEKLFKTGYSSKLSDLFSSGFNSHFKYVLQVFFVSLFFIIAMTYVVYGNFTSLIHSRPNVFYFVCALLGIGIIIFVYSTTSILILNKAKPYKEKIAIVPEWEANRCAVYCIEKFLKKNKENLHSSTQEVYPKDYFWFRYILKFLKK